MVSSLRQTLRLGLLLAASAGLASCAGINGSTGRFVSAITPYKVDVVQGNFVSSEQVALLRPGMPRQTVRDLLGTPLLQDVFHANRWDYVFTFKRSGQEPQRRRVTVFFQDDVLDHFDADPLPTEAEFVASLDSGRATGKVPVLEATEEALKKFPAAKPAEEPKPLPPLPDSYPPLEAGKP